MRAAAATLALLLAGSPTLAEDARPAGPDRPTLVLSGKASREAPPDFALIQIGVTNKASTTQAAIDATSTAAGRIVAAAKAAGIEGRDLQTSYLALLPAYRTSRDTSGSSEQRPDGFTASNTVTLRVRDTGKLGELLRTVVDGGANRIGRIDFGLDDPAKLEREALAAAVEDARLQADTIAKAAGVKLGRIEEIRSGAAEPPPVLMRQRAYASPAPAAAPPVPVEAGSLAASATVQIVFSIDP